ncbi:MAG: alpha-L-rhamnosidase C-terminal domain-containing protein [Planctomycetia bacterium]|nr:alpha-L-rhamnosidase C-terminal domain-containing protein [Planctomycetia bacterium]
MKSMFFIRSFAVFAGLAFLFSGSVFAQSVDPISRADLLPPGINSDDLAARSVPDQRVRRFVIPKKVVWQSQNGIFQQEKLLTIPYGQTTTSDMKNGFTMKKNKGQECAILLDFGLELHGGIRLDSRSLSPSKESVGRTARIRVRFGESADEAMAEMGEKGSTNDHSVRDMIVSVPFLGSIEFGESAFRFVRLDLIDEGSEICFDSVRAVFIYRDLPWIGSFRSSDERLNRIWKTAAYTQHLTMQNYIFEGAKRDRLVWYGDFNPQTMSTVYVFGTPKILKDSLGQFARDTWPLPKWMNGMPNYSLWWLISISDVYRYSGDRDYLKEQFPYIKGLIKQLEKSIGPNGEAAFPNPFLDWPTNKNKPALRAGTHAMFAIAFERVNELARSMGDQELEKETADQLKKIRSFYPDHCNNKQAASLLALADLQRPGTSNTAVVAKNGPEGFSTFYGYYMLEALAKGKKKQLALEIIRQYWGAMIDVGATTFWEDFDLDWLKESARIDELTPKGKKSLHGDYGAWCYIGFRHSLCHAWSSGPAAWLSAHVLGVVPAEPGFKSVRIDPFLGDLDWAEGSVPTPYGPIRVKLSKDSAGKIKKEISAPKEVKICD